MPTDDFGRPLTEDELAALRGFVEAHGTVAAARRAGVSREVVARVLARLAVQRGTAALVRASLVSPVDTPFRHIA